MARELPIINTDKRLSSAVNEIYYYAAFDVVGGIPFYYNAGGVAANVPYYKWVVSSVEMPATITDDMFEVRSTIPTLYTTKTVTTVGNRKTVTYNKPLTADLLRIDKNTRFEVIPGIDLVAGGALESFSIGIENPAYQKGIYKIKLRLVHANTLTPEDKYEVGRMTHDPVYGDEDDSRRLDRTSVEKEFTLVVYSAYQWRVRDFINQNMPDNIKNNEELKVLLDLIAITFGDIWEDDEEIYTLVDVDDMPEEYLEPYGQSIGYTYDPYVASSLQRFYMKRYLKNQRWRGTLKSIKTVITSYAIDEESYFENDLLSNVKIYEYGDGQSYTPLEGELWGPGAITIITPRPLYLLYDKLLEVLPGGVRLSLIRNVLELGVAVNVSATHNGYTSTDYTTHGEEFLGISAVMLDYTLASMWNRRLNEDIFDKPYLDISITREDI